MTHDRELNVNIWHPTCAPVSFYPLLCCGKWANLSRPKPPSCYTWPTVSPCLRVEFACSGSSCLYPTILRLRHGHVQPHLGAFVLLNWVRNQCTILIQADTAKVTTLCRNWLIAPTSWFWSWESHDCHPWKQYKVQAPQFQLAMLCLGWPDLWLFFYFLFLSNLNILVCIFEVYNVPPPQAHFWKGLVVDVESLVCFHCSPLTKDMIQDLLCKWSSPVITLYMQQLRSGC